MENIENIKKEIKEKIRNNSKYVNPMNKEFQEDIKMYGFKSGYEYTTWMQKNGILKNPTDIKRKELEHYVRKAGCKNNTEYQEYNAKKRGYTNLSDYVKQWQYKNGISSPTEDNEDCTYYFGLYIAQHYVMKTFEDPILMPPTNPKFDWLCKNGEKIEHKARCLAQDTGKPNTRWKCTLADCNGNFNDEADWFILSMWDSRKSLTPLHILAFYKDDIVRGDPFWMRGSISITNTSECLEEFREYEVTNRLEKLKELCKKRKRT